jgi:heme exporter protein D
VGVTAVLLALEVLQARWAHRAVLVQLKAEHTRASLLAQESAVEELM